MLRLVRLADDATDLIVAAAIAPVAYLAADLASGLVHWFCDTFFCETSPLIGRLLIQPFREHHRDPLALTRHGFFELNGNNCLALIPMLALWSWQQGNLSGAPSVACEAFVVWFSFAVFATNQLHKWAHAHAVREPVRWLQQRGLVLSPEHHSVHHRAPHGRAYCVASGWMNPLVDRLGLFPWLESVARGIGITRQDAPPIATRAAA